jgi:hypothetical protein
MAGANRPSCRNHRTVGTDTRNKRATSSIVMYAFMIILRCQVPDAGLHATLAVRRVFQFSHSPLFLASHIATYGEVLIQDANYPQCPKGQVEAVSGLIPLAMLGSRIRSVGRSLGVAEAYPQREPRALSSCGSLLAAVPAFAKPNLHVVGQMPRNQLYSVDGLVSEALPASTFPGARTWPTVSFVPPPDYRKSMRRISQ